jgi:hypothetical protein
MPIVEDPALQMTVNVTFNVPLLMFVLAILAALLVYGGVMRYRHRRIRRREAELARLITEYFRQHELEVSTRCFNVLDGRRFVAVVESPPIKRFRYSHIIESSLIQHLEKTADAIVDKIYWRFPLAWQSVAEDPYFADSRSSLLEPEEAYRVEDASWESYQKSRGPEKPPGS